MFLPTKVAKKLSTYLTYGLFCAFSLVGVLYAGKDTAKQYKAVLQTKEAMRKAELTLNLDRYRVVPLTAGEDGGTMVAGEGEDTLLADKAAGKSMKELVQEKRVAAQAYEAAEYRFDLLVMAWVPLALCWLVVVSVYADAESWSGVAVSCGVAVVVVWFLTRFCHAFGTGIWEWLLAPVAGHSHGFWLLAAAAAGITVAAIRHDFFRAKSLTPTE